MLPFLLFPGLTVLAGSYFPRYLSNEVKFQQPLDPEIHRAVDISQSLFSLVLTSLPFSDTYSLVLNLCQTQQRPPLFSSEGLLQSLLGT